MKKICFPPQVCKGRADQSPATLGEGKIQPRSGRAYAPLRPTDLAVLL
ncbi:MAG: hypothetical protein LC802_18870 [Acidobacteria bacterium]|nr:hypothetical protein [Acidobacteriota bacterium]